MSSEHFDVLIVGAGLSGIGAAYRLNERCPGKTYAIVEGRDASAAPGTCSAIPGIRSDSDMFTLGYPFRPWPESRTSIAEGPRSSSTSRRPRASTGSIRRSASTGTSRGLRGPRATRAGRSTSSARDTGESEPMTLRLPVHVHRLLPLRRRPIRPSSRAPSDSAARSSTRSTGPKDLDYAGKRVVVIGSGATAVTLVPAMAQTAAHVTMLQRSPSYIVSFPAIDPVAEAAAQAGCPAMAPTRSCAAQERALPTADLQLCRRVPGFVRARDAQGRAEHCYPPATRSTSISTPATTHGISGSASSPTAICSRRSAPAALSVVTDQIETFTERGLRLASGARAGGGHDRHRDRARPACRSAASS